VVSGIHHRGKPRYVVVAGRRFMWSSALSRHYKLCCGLAAGVRPAMLSCSRQERKQLVAGSLL
jgi:hypothetical protein